MPASVTQTLVKIENDSIEASGLLTNKILDLSSLSSFLGTFPLVDENIYSILFERHSDLMQTQKKRFAVANLEKILTATFNISTLSGFEKMSLRDLSKQAGMSMGAIYSCITKKEDIAYMIADIVKLSSELTEYHALSDGMSAWDQVTVSIKSHLYASSVLQVWYFFLYFETRSLPDQQQTESKQLELDVINGFESILRKGIENEEFRAVNSQTIANMIVVMLQDWYLKPWKNYTTSRSRGVLTMDVLKTGSVIANPIHSKEYTIEQRENDINIYYHSLTSMLEKILIN